MRRVWASACHAYATLLVPRAEGAAQHYARRRPDAAHGGGPAQRMCGCTVPAPPSPARVVDCARARIPGVSGMCACTKELQSKIEPPKYAGLAASSTLRLTLALTRTDNRLQRRIVFWRRSSAPQNNRKIRRRQARRNRSSACPCPRARTRHHPCPPFVYAQQHRASAARARAGRHSISETWKLALRSATNSAKFLLLASMSSKVEFDIHEGFLSSVFFGGNSQASAFWM